MTWINRRRLPPDSSLFDLHQFRAGHDIYRGVTQFAPAPDNSPFGTQESR